MFVLRITSVFMLFSAFNVIAADYSGSVVLYEKGKPAAKAEYSDIVVYFVPDEPIESSIAPMGKEMQITMEKKTFLPRVLPITTGTAVSFPNFDPILHNAFSTSRNNKFDLGIYGGGETAGHTFDKSGLVRVYCNVHHAMVAYILVFDNPFFTQTDNNGQFTLMGLPAASGKLFIWHPRAKPIKQAIDLAADMKGEEFKLALTKRRVPKHKNKEGKSYRKARDKNY